jgi:predicted nuclease of predicted toxin-antitoxin system
VKFLPDHDVPDDLSYLLKQLGHDVTLLREDLLGDSPDESVFRFAYETGCILLTCNRDDFLHLAATEQHHRLVIVIRRRTRGDERGVAAADRACGRNWSQKQRQLRLRLAATS